MPTHDPNLWGAGDAYERYMGRWSRGIAPVFIRWLEVAPGGRWADIGCGTGVVTQAVLAACDPSEILGLDSSDIFLQSAAANVADPRVTFRQGNAQAIAEPDDEFDVAVSCLVLNFLPDKDAAIREMARIVRPGGTVAVYVWDYAGHMQVMRRFFDVAIALDPAAAEYDDGIKAPVCRPQPLVEILTRSGLRDVEIRAIDIPAAFDSFDDYWAPFLGGTGSAPKYCMSLDELARDRLRQEVQRRLPTGPDGEILLAVRAWAAKGRVF
ncbi:MAG: class I SAM-dependent methyltransferase [Mesorhizobium sp.]